MWNIVEYYVFHFFINMFFWTFSKFWYDDMGVNIWRHSKIGVFKLQNMLLWYLLTSIVDIVIKHTRKSQIKFYQPTFFKFLNSPFILAERVC